MEAMALTFIIAAVMVLVWGWAPWYRWKYRHIPGFSGLPFLGNVPDVVLHNGLVPLYRKAHKRFGRVFMIWMGTTPFVVIGEPTAARAIALRSKRRAPIIFPFAFLTGEQKRVFDAELLTIPDEGYHSSLKAVWPGAFRSSKFAEYSQIMRDCLADALAHLESVALKGEQINVMDFFGNVAMAMTGSSAFGVDLGVFKKGESHDGQAPDFGPRLMSAVKYLFEVRGFGISIYFLLGLIFCEYPRVLAALRAAAALLPDPVLIKAAQARKVAFGLLRPIMLDAQRRAGFPVSSDTRQALERLGVRQVGEGGFMSHIIHGVHRDTKSPFTNEEILAQAMSFLEGGYETTTTFLTFTTYLLLRNPDKLAKLQQELDGVAEEEIGNIQPGQLPYLDAVQKESFRVYFLPNVLSRRTAVDMNVCGYHIPKGTCVHLSAEHINRDKELWDRPDEFLPERWLPEDPLATHAPENLFSFGFGALQCAGMRFAQRESTLTLAAVFRKFDFLLCPGQEELATTSMFVYKPTVGVFAVPKLRP